MRSILSLCVGIIMMAWCTQKDLALVAALLPRPDSGLLQVVGPDSVAERSGYAVNTPLSTAVEDFNRRATRDAIGRKQPKLSSREVIAAIRCWNRNTDAIGDSAFQVFQSIGQSKIMPRGSFLRFIPGVIAINGFDVDVWWIDLQIGLDKYPTDLADVPMYQRRIRTTYVRSQPHVSHH